MPIFRKNRAVEEHNLESWLVSRDEAKQALAAETLALMHPEQRLNYLLSLVDREQKARVKRVGVAACVYIPTLLTLLAVLIFDHQHHQHLPGPFPFLFGPINAFLSRPTKLQKRAHEILTQSPLDARVLCTVVNGWTSGFFSDANVPARYVTRALQSFDAEDAGVLNKGQWTFLLQWLAPRRTKTLDPETHTALVRAILLACANIGMTDALPRVKSLAEAKTQAPEIQQLQQTARNYVTLLENTANIQKRVVGH